MCKEYKFMVSNLDKYLVVHCNGNYSVNVPLMQIDTYAINAYRKKCLNKNCRRFYEGNNFGPFLMKLTKDCSSHI